MLSSVELHNPTHVSIKPNFRHTFSDKAVVHYSRVLTNVHFELISVQIEVKSSSGNSSAQILHLILATAEVISPQIWNLEPTKLARSQTTLIMSHPIERILL